MTEAKNICIMGNPGWKCTETLGDGSVCGKDAFMQYDTGYKCDWCSPPTCGMCTKASAIGWTYMIKPGYTMQKKTYVCPTCTPFKVKNMMTRNPRGYIKVPKPRKRVKCLTLESERKRRRAAEVKRRKENAD